MFIALLEGWLKTHGCLKSVFRTSSFSQPLLSDARRLNDYSLDIAVQSPKQKSFVLHPAVRKGGDLVHGILASPSEIVS